MKRLVYWIAATLLIVALLAVIFTGANAIAAQHWPFGTIWGGVIVLLGVLLWWVGRRKSARIREKWIPVRPKNYRRIALYAIQHAGNPVVLMNGRQINDFSESGPLTQKGIHSCQDFEIRDGEVPILGFHDHPDQMWIVDSRRQLADHCVAQGWLKIQGRAS